MSKLIDADALERDGWHMSRTVRVYEDLMEIQTRKPTDFPPIIEFDGEVNKVVVNGVEYKPTIESQNAIDVIDKYISGFDAIDANFLDGLKTAKKLIKELPPAQPEKQHGRMFQEIVVEYPSYSTYPEYKGKPYFSIKYTENGQGFIGYGTYKPEVLSKYLKEDFMPSAQLERKKGETE